MDFASVNQQFASITAYCGRVMTIGGVTLHGVPDTTQLLQDGVALEVGTPRLAAVSFARAELLAQLGRIPIIGDVVVWDTVSYTIDDVDAVAEMPRVTCFLRTK